MRGVLLNPRQHKFLYECDFYHGTANVIPLSCGQHNLIRLLLGFLAGVLGVLINLTPFGPQLEESLGLSWLFTLRGPISPANKAVVIAIDKAQRTNRVYRSREAYGPEFCIGD
jgi:hypothetical protein